MTYVGPDGPVPCDIAIVGEAPAREEVRLGRGFVGPSGKLLWPVLRRLAKLDRHECYVTNLSKYPLEGEEGGAKMSEDEFVACVDELMVEMAQVRPSRVLAVGALAARAFLGEAYTRMEVHNGMTYDMGEYSVTPCWHPAAALYEDAGKDPLAWMGDAMAHFREPRKPGTVVVPPYDHRAWVSCAPRPIAIDTEGTPEDPVCVQWSGGLKRHWLLPEEAVAFWGSVVASGRTVIYHNAPWDWAVLEAMGVKSPELVPFVDTMELAYLRQTEPQGLKDLAYRHWGVRMRTFEEVVLPYYDEVVRAIALGKADAGTTITTHSPKTGKAYKKPKVQRTEEAKALVRTENVATLRERIGEFPGPSLRFVPEAEMLEYATLDPYMTYKVWEALK